MEALEISFSDALAHLQTLLGKRICVLVNVRGSFSGCVIEGELVRVLTLPPDNSAVNIVIGDRRQGIVLDPADVDAHLAGDQASGGPCLVFHLPAAVDITVEAV